MQPGAVLRGIGGFERFSSTVPEDYSLWRRNRWPLAMNILAQRPIEQPRVETMGFEQMAKAADRGFVGRRFAGRRQFR